MSFEILDDQLPSMWQSRRCTGFDRRDLVPARNNREFGIPGPSGSRTQSASVRVADSGSNVANPIIFHHCKPATLATKLQPLRVGNGFSIRDAVMLGKSYKANSFRSK
jgi:hypothetical protein